MTSSIVRIGMGPRRAGMSLTDFAQHYRDVHAGEASQIPGVQAYVQWHPVLDATGVRPLPYPGFDACSTMDFESHADLEAAFASPAYQGRVRDDERRFVDPDRHSRIVGTRIMAYEPRSGEVGLVVALRRHPEASVRQFRTAVERWATAPGGAGVDVVLAADDPPDGRPNAADAVVFRLFSSSGEATEWALADGGGVSDWALTRFVFGTAAFVGTPYRVL